MEANKYQGSILIHQPDIDIKMVPDFLVNGVLEWGGLQNLFLALTGLFGGSFLTKLFELIEKNEISTGQIQVVVLLGIVTAIFLGMFYFFHVRQSRVARQIRDYNYRSITPEGNVEQA